MFHNNSIHYFVNKNNIYMNFISIDGWSIGMEQSGS
jgi:hypothetical protein